MTSPSLVRASSLLMIAVLLSLDVSPARAQGDIAAALDQANLRPLLQAGRVAKYSTWSSRKRTITEAGRAQTVTTESVFEVNGDVTWTIVRVNGDGSATCTMTCDWLTATSKRTGKPDVHSDTRKGRGDSEGLDNMLKAVVGVPLTVNVAADGTVTKVTGVDAMRQKAGEDGIVPDEEDFMESASDLAVIAGGAEAARLRGSWKTRNEWNYTLELPGIDSKMEYDTTHTLSSVEEIAGIRVATVTGESKLRLNVDREMIPDIEGVTIDIRLVRGEATSQVMVDLSRGEAVGRNTTQSATVETKITTPLGAATQTVQEFAQSQVLRIAEK